MMKIAGVVHYTLSQIGDDIAFKEVSCLEECEGMIKALLRVPGVFSAGVTFIEVYDEEE